MSLNNVHDACTFVDLLVTGFRFHFAHAFVNWFDSLNDRYTALMKSSSGYGIAFFISANVVRWVLILANRVMMC